MSRVLRLWTVHHVSHDWQVTGLRPVVMLSGDKANWLSDE